MSRTEKWLPFIVGCALALPTVLVRCPPMADYALHEAIVGLMRHYGDPHFAPHELYRLNLGHPNQLFYFLAWLLSYPFGVTKACELVIAAGIVLIPVSGAYFCRAFGKWQWITPLLAPLAVGWLYYWGLIANILSISVFLFALPTFDRYAEKPNWRGLAQVCAFIVLLYEAHEATLLSACAVYGVLCIVRPITIKRSLARAVPLAVALTIAMTQLRLQRANFRAGTEPPETEAFVPLMVKLKVLPSSLFAGFELWVQIIVFTLALGVALTFVYLRVADREKTTRTVRTWLHDLRFEVAALMLFAAYWAAPSTFTGATLIFHRFLPLAWALFVVCASPSRRTKVPRLTPLLASAVPIGVALINWPQFSDANDVFEQLDEVSQSIEIGSPVLAVQLSDKGNRLFPLATAAGHVVATRGGRAAYDFTQSPISPLLLRLECDWPLTRERLVQDARYMRPTYDFRRFRYVVFHARDAWLLDVAAHIVADEGRVIARKGEWMVVESKLKVRGLCKPDWKIPNPPPMTFQQRWGKMIVAAAANGDQIDYTVRFPEDHPDAGARTGDAAGSNDSTKDAGASDASPADSAP
jgi:hypothetical protein